MKASLIALFLITILVGCNSSSKTQKESSFLGVYTPVDSSLNIIITDSVNFIPLETKEECLIGNPDKYKVVKDRIYVADMKATNSLYVFNINGKFLNKYSSHGKGPQEFAGRINDFDVKDQVYLLTNFGEVICLSLEGEFRWKKKINIYPRAISRRSDGFCFGMRYHETVPTNRKKDEYYNVVLTDHDLNITKKIQPFVYNVEGKRFRLSYSIFSYDTTTYLVPNISDSILVINREKINSYKILDSGYNSNQTKDNDFINKTYEEGKLSYIDNILFANKNQLAFCYRRNRKPRVCLFDLKEKRVESIRGYNYNIPNFTTLPFPFEGVATELGDEFFEIVHYTKIKKFKEQMTNNKLKGWKLKSGFKKKLIKCVESSDVNSNPIVIRHICKL